MTIYAIGDIHGQRAMLEAAHARIAADRARCGATDAPVVHLGDLTDRGPDSRGVLNLLIDGIAAKEPWIVLLGNHDRMFREFLNDASYHDPMLRPELSWFDRRLGGATTLASYGVERAGSRPLAHVHKDAVAAVPASHRELLADLPLMHVTDDLVFVHAGIRPGVALEDQTEDDLVWIRKGFLEDTTDHGRLVIHGHTALDAPAHFGNRVDLDSGAGYGQTLTAAVFEGRDCFVLEEGGRVALSP